MTTYYFDTSGLIKRYVTETGSGWVWRLFSPEFDHFFLTSRLTMPEIYSALARRLREGSVSAAAYSSNLQVFQRDSTTTYRYIELTMDVVNLSRDLLAQHALRASDAVQLASALGANRLLVTGGLAPLVFVAADERLLAVARAEGMAGENPNDYAV
ncbi:MAG: type II toxin-antitoxin system VapC family toxin [Anaerolineales bacterium]|nr:type II toxin-antitoxin system VapC family toxin [Anaerolineales bacterium]